MPASEWFNKEFERCMQNFGYMPNWATHEYMRKGGPNIMLRISPANSERYALTACWISQVKLVKDVSTSTIANQNPETFRRVQGNSLRDLVNKVNIALNGRLELTLRGISKDLVGLLPPA